MEGGKVESRIADEALSAIEDCTLSNDYGKGECRLGMRGRRVYNGEKSKKGKDRTKVRRFREVWRT